MLFLFCFFIGFFTGLRSLTAPAITAWAVYLGRMKPEHPFSWIGSFVSVVIFTLLAFVELIADKLPKTPNRTSPPGLIARILMGGLTGACMASSKSDATVVGAMLGIAGALAGTFTGFKARTGIVKAFGIPDTFVALFEDLVAIGGSFLVTF